MQVEHPDQGGCKYWDPVGGIALCVGLSPGAAAFPEPQLSLPQVSSQDPLESPWFILPTEGPCGPGEQETRVDASLKDAGRGSLELLPGVRSSHCI